RFCADTGRDILRRADGGDSSQGNGLSQRERRVTGTRRQIDDEVIEPAPVNLDHHRLDRLADHWAAVDGWLAARVDVPERHQLHAVRVDGEEEAVRLLRDGSGAGQ